MQGPSGHYGAAPTRSTIWAVDTLRGILERPGRGQCPGGGPGNCTQLRREQGGQESMLCLSANNASPSRGDPNIWPAGCATVYTAEPAAGAWLCAPKRVNRARVGARIEPCFAAGHVHGLCPLLGWTSHPGPTPHQDGCVWWPGPANTQGSLPQELLAEPLVRHSACLCLELQNFKSLQRVSR